MGTKKCSSFLSSLKHNNDLAVSIVLNGMVPSRLNIIIHLEFGARCARQEKGFSLRWSEINSENAKKQNKIHEYLFKFFNQLALVGDCNPPVYVC